MSKMNSIHKISLSLFMATVVLISSSAGQAQLLRRALAQADLKQGEPVARPPEAKPVQAEVDAADGDGKMLAIRVVAVQGMVQIRAVETEPWVPAKVGMDLSIGSEIRTGLRSICQFTIDGNHTISLDRLGVVKVLDAIEKDGKIKTDVGMKYGRTQYKVESGAADHDALIHAPSATLAVRGSLVTFEDNDAFGARAVVDHSKNTVYKQRGANGSVRVVQVQLKKGEVGQDPNGAGKTPLTAAQQAIRNSINDTGDRRGRANDLERDLVAAYPIFNGAPGAGGPPRPGDIQNNIKDPFLGDGGLIHGGGGSEGGGSEGGGGEGGGPQEGDIIQGSLTLNATWTGPDPFVFFLNDPIGGQLSTVNNLPTGASTVVRPGGPAQGNAPSTINTATLVYGIESVVGAYGVGIASNAGGPPAGSNSFDITVQFNDINGLAIIDEFSGVVDSLSPAAGFNFFLPGDPGTVNNN